jgi:anti-sigma factor RsiW
MNCQDVHKLLHPYSDGELDLVRSLEVEEHLSSCTACAEQQTNLRSLHDALSSRSLYYSAPDALRARLQLATNPVTPQTRERQTWLRPLALAAGILLLVGMSATLAILFFRGANRATSGLEDWVIASHVRSLQVNHLTDVVSSDRHTVKPWFRDKLDFSPQVPELAPQGFPLAGGRLDYLDGRAVAALVYQRGKHAINVFTWPATNGDGSARDFDRQGFHIRAWQQASMNYWAISDVNEADLDQFVRLFREQTADSRP